MGNAVEATKLTLIEEVVARDIRPYIELMPGALKCSIWSMTGKCRDRLSRVLHFLFFGNWKECQAQNEFVTPNDKT